MMKKLILSLFALAFILGSVGTIYAQTITNQPGSNNQQNTGNQSQSGGSSGVGGSGTTTNRTPTGAPATGMGGTS